MARKWRAERDALHAQIDAGDVAGPTGTSSDVSKAWAQARKWKAERDALHAQIDAGDVAGPTDDVSKAWAQARKWRAERDALHAQIDAGSSGSTDEVSKAWTQARTWKSDRDILRANYQALMGLVWESRRDMTFWKQNEHPDHIHPIFEHLHNAGYTV